MSFEELIFALWTKKKRSFSAWDFKDVIGDHIPWYRGQEQHDSFEFFTNILDELHEDVNRIVENTYSNVPDSDGRPDEIVAKEQWDNFKSRNDSMIVDSFFGQIKNKFKCHNWQYENLKFDSYSSLSLPLPSGISQTFDLDLVYHPYNYEDEGGITRYQIQNWRTNTTFKSLSEQMGLVLGDNINFQFYVQKDKKYNLLSKVKYVFIFRETRWKR